MSLEKGAGNLRGQVATEFMLYTAVFMFIAIAAFVVVNQLMTTEIPLQQNTVAKETGMAFADALTLSVKGGTGFSYNYRFPATLFGIPYKVYLTNASDGFLVMEWVGEHGEFSYSYAVPSYPYEFGGGCIRQENGNIFVESDRCSNVLTLNNDGENLTITQLP